MPRQEHSRAPEPTAPPIHMMPQCYSSPADELRDRSPPPRYEEAIAENWPTPSTAPPVPTQNSSNQASNPIRIASLSPYREVAQNSRQDEREARPNSCNSSKISTPGHSSEHRRHSGHETHRPRSSNSRYESGSVSDLSDGSHEERNTTAQTSARGERRKKGSGSKIKRGLENIAFFIIQILD